MLSPVIGSPSLPPFYDYPHTHDPFACASNQFDCYLKTLLLFPLLCLQYNNYYRNKINILAEKISSIIEELRENCVRSFYLISSFNFYIIKMYLF